VTSDDQQSRRRITLQLPNDVIAWIDRFRGEWGLRGRGPTVERLLRELFADQHDELASSSDPFELNGPADPADASSPSPEAVDRFDEGGTLVLVSPSHGGQLSVDFEARHTPERPRHRPTAGGIELPGFVRRQSDQLKRAAQVQLPPEGSSRETFALIDPATIETAMAVAGQHWQELYGSPPNEHVLEAAMGWLAQDIWPHVDQSDGRPFTWSLATSVTAQLAPSWSSAEPSFERVLVMAGLLEDPFSASTLGLRIPTLIRRFVHRFRRSKRRGMSFETLEHTMSLHGALKLLQLPTTPGNRLTLSDIREAYREQALQHHPDSGGSAEHMRRLNEAYQLLKELYRTS